MKKNLKWLFKAIVAGCAALVLLNLFAFFWYNVPVHYENPSGATEYVWERHKFYSKATEGFALGRTNNEGFNNINDYHEGDSIDILLMGSSHTEGFNVAQDENSGAIIIIENIDIAFITAQPPDLPQRTEHKIIDARFRRMKQ